MDDLLQSQIRDSCRLALPEGLKDLMWDISREVLRAQPRDLYGFITDYLAALMVVRENLRVAAHVCDTMCNEICHLKLEEEFKKLGMHTKEAIKTAELVKEYFEKKSVVNECNLITKLMNETTLEERFLPQIQSVIREAFLEHHAYGAVMQSEEKNGYDWSDFTRGVTLMPSLQSSSESEIDDVRRATRHTLHIYKQGRPTQEEYVRAGITIQAAYRAYKVRRQNSRLRDKGSKECRWTMEPEHLADFYGPDEDHRQSAEPVPLQLHVDESDESTHIGQPYISTASSTSLAGSFLQLPKHKPYNPHNNIKEILCGLEELPEKEHATIDYTQEHPYRVFTKTSKHYEFSEKESRRTIKFGEQKVEVIEDIAEKAEHSDESIEEVNEVRGMRSSGSDTD